MEHRRFRQFVRRSAKAACRLIYAPQRLCGRTPNRFVFLIGHIRSGSSVLSHILFSNPEILGYGETHIHYRTRADLQSLINEVHFAKRSMLLRDAWILDKMVNESCYSKYYLPSNGKCFFIFLVREPLATLRSMTNAFREWYRHDPHWFNDCEPTREGFQGKACKEYMNALSAIMECADKIDDLNRAVFVLHSTLLENTEAVFRAIETMLELRTPLSESYAITPTTGRIMIGDTSPNIRKGYLDRTIETSDVPIDAEIVRQCQDIFEECCRRLERFAVGM